MRLKEALDANRKLTDERTQLNHQLNEYSALNDTVKMLKDKLGKSAIENQGLGEEIRTAQENLRLSANQNQKLIN